MLGGRLCSCRQGAVSVAIQVFASGPISGHTGVWRTGFFADVCPV